MSTLAFLFVGFVGALLLASCPAACHVPIIAEGSGNISSAAYISDPGKSWAVYGFLSPNQTEYFCFDAQKGEQIYLSMIKSANPAESDFCPSMALIGPGINANGQTVHGDRISIPDSDPDSDPDSHPDSHPDLHPDLHPDSHIYSLSNSLPLAGLPESYGILVLAGENTRNTTYEPFGPSSFIQLAEINLSAPEDGRYYAAVFSNATPGHYGLTVGYREEFGFMERIGLPLKLISVYLWSGQSPAMILIPYLMAEIVGILVFWRSSRRTAYSFAGTLAAFLFLATSASILNQTVFNLTRAPFGPEVYVSLGLAAFHAILGVVAIHLARGEAGLLQRVLIGVIGTIALLSGSGLIMGPILAVAASVLPSMNGPVLHLPRISRS